MSGSSAAADIGVGTFQPAPDAADLAAILRATPQPVVVLRPHGQVVFASPAFVEMLDLGEPPGPAFTLDRHFVGPSGCRDLVAGVIRQGAACVEEARLITARGRCIPVRIDGRKVMADEPLVALWLQGLDANAQMDRLLRASFHLAPMPMVLARERDGVIEMSNRRALELIGRPGAGTGGLTLDRMIGGEGLRRLMARLAGGGFVDDFEIRLETAYHETIWTLVSGQIAEIEGERRLLLGFLDITDNRSAKETLRSFFEAAPVPMILCRTSDGHVLRLNESAIQLLGVAQGCSSRIEEFLDPFAGQHLRMLMRAGESVDGREAQIKGANGESIWGLISLRCISVAGDLCALVGINDITKRKLAEEDLRRAKVAADMATQAKSVFLATMSHEIRTPMNGVLGILDVMCRTPLTWEQRGLLDVMRDSARALVSIINDILDLSKIESGQFQVEVGPFGLRDLIDGVVELMAAKARENGNEIAAMVAADVPDGLEGDEVRLRQILLNLVGNAIKFTSLGHVDLSVEVVDVAAGHAALRFEIRDTGIGLAEDEMAKVFQPFVQADAATTRRFGGTGLGLSICHRLVELMGGRIGVTSTKGRGSTFWLELPFAIREHRRPPAAVDLSGLTVLVLEANAVALAGMHDSIAHAGASVVAASTGREALNLLRRRRTSQAGAAASPPDMVVASHGPNFDGLGFCELLVDTGKFPAGRILVAACDETEATASRWRRLGLAGQVLKPWGAMALRRLARLAGRAPVEAEVEGSVETEFPTPESREEAIASGRLVLIAEDNAINRMVMGVQVEQLGFAFEMVENGRQALEKVASGLYGLLITDCQMPEMDGYTLSQAIRRAEEQSGGRRLPIIAVTAAALAGDRERCLAAGMDDYLSKPVRYERLEHLLKRYLPLRRTAPTPAASGLPPGAAAPDSGPIDLGALADILGTDNPAVMAEVLSFFPPAFADCLAAIDAACAPLERTALRAAAHAAKGAARNAAATALAATLQALEASAGSAGEGELRRLVGAAHDQSLATASYIDTWMSVSA